MKWLSLSLLASLQLAACLPPPLSGPEDCKILPGDANWPTLEIWKESLKGVQAREKDAAPGSPDYRFNANTVGKVQAAVKFAAKHNLRLSILNSGHDFVGR
jgi:hypothetical protein